MTVVVPLVCFVLPLLAGFYAIRTGLRWAVPVLALGFAALMVWALLEGRQAQGWDGIGYGIVAILMAAPALLGTLSGAGLAWWRNRRARKSQE